MAIHPTAVIDAKAELDSTAEIGPYCIIDGPVKIGAHTILRAHVHLSGWTEIGENCDIHPFAVVGDFPQDLSYHGEETYCKIGNGVIIREMATIHRGAMPESSTVVGDDCFLMNYSHIAHNCRLGKAVKLANMATLGGHVQIDDGAFVSAFVGIHQFCRIGCLAFVSGDSRISMDVPPFMTTFGESTIIGHNVVGMRRAGYSREAIHEIRQAFKTLYRSGRPFRQAIEQLAESVETDAGQVLVDFLLTESKRGHCTGRKRRRTQTLEANPEPTEDSQPA